MTKATVTRFGNEQSDARYDPYREPENRTAPLTPRDRTDGIDLDDEDAKDEEVKDGAAAGVRGGIQGQSHQREGFLERTR